jgi:protoporphyrinogen oxidase
VDVVVSTLPLPLLLRLMDPAPPDRLMRVAAGLRYRHVRLVALCLDKPTVTAAATVYFPDAGFPFTRVYEPRNRSREMSPEGQTSLVAELPCQDEDSAWTGDDGEVIDLVRRHLEDIAWIGAGELLDACSKRLGNAYPVLDTGSERRVAAIADDLGGLRNLHLSGRSGRFVYGWIHTMMAFGREIVEEIAGGA